MCKEDKLPTLFRLQNWNAKILISFRFLTYLITNAHCAVAQSHTRTVCTIGNAWFEFCQYSPIMKVKDWHNRPYFHLRIQFFQVFIYFTTCMLCRMNCPKPRHHTSNAEHLTVKTEKFLFEFFEQFFVTSVHFDILGICRASWWRS